MAALARIGWARLGCFYSCSVAVREAWRMEDLESHDS